jgi:hypothetical protein
MNMNNIEDIYPVSPVQESLFQSEHCPPESGARCKQLSFRMRGELDATAFAKAWEEVVNRQPMLRTSFLWKRVERP